MASRRDFFQYSAAFGVLAMSPGYAWAESSRQMPRRVIPGTPESLGTVGYGNASVFREGDMASSSELVRLFLEHGGSYIDTSGNGRNTIAQIMREQSAHDRLFVGTYIDGKDLPSMRAEIQSILAVQGGDSLDLVLSRDPEDFGRRRDQFRQLKEEGLTRFVGVARQNQRYYAMMMELMKDGALDFIQVNYSIVEPEAANEILPLAMETDIAVLINRPFINGRYFSIVQDQQLPQWAVEFDCASWAQFSLKYILAHPAVTCVLTETSNPKHAIDNFGAAFGRVPDAETRKKMEDIIKFLA